MDRRLLALTALVGALACTAPREDAPERRETVGNFWPYTPTLYDYVYRVMPHAVPGSLPPEDVFSLVAYIVHLNELLPVDRHSLPQVVMPARDRFVYDDRTGGEQGR